MSNVVDMRNRGELDSQGGMHPSPFPQESELYFTAVERPLQWLDKNDGARAIDTHKVLVRPLVYGDAVVPQQLAVVGEGYNLVQNQDLYQSIEDQFMSMFSSQELEGVRVNDSMSYGGRICLREYQFPNVRCDLGGVSDIAFRTIVKNGFGGSSIALYTGAIDFFCTNGMIGGQFDCMYARHTKGLRIADVTHRVRRAIDVFYKQADIWRGWHARVITDQQAQDFFEAIYSYRLANKLLRQYFIEQKVHGPNIWALYSAMTYYASHDEGEFVTRKTGTDHSAVTLLKREEQVQHTVASDAWSALAA